MKAPIRQTKPIYDKTPKPPTEYILPTPIKKPYGKPNPNAKPMPRQMSLDAINRRLKG